MMALTLALPLPGCAAILEHGPDAIPIASDPGGARVYLNERLVGETPTVINVPHDEPCSLRIELDGYAPVVLQEDKVLSGWFIGSIFFWGLVGIVVDVATNNVTHYPTDPVTVTLEAVSRDGRKAPLATLTMVPVEGAKRR
jgi:hypothetical protein